MRRLKLILLVGLLALCGGLYGCSGDDGDDGRAGTPGLSAYEIAVNNGFTGTEAEWLASLDTAALLTPESCVVCHGIDKWADVETFHDGNVADVQVTATVDSFTVAGGFATINFTVLDANGDPLPGLTAAQASDATRSQYFRIAYSQLTPGATAADPNVWVDLTTGDRLFANLTDNTDGTYTYVSTTDISATYDPALLTRVLVMVQTGDEVPVAFNATDEIPGTDPVITRDVVTTVACNACHGRLGSPEGTAVFHSGQRYTSDACTVCHTTTLGGGEGYYPTMVHKIHAAMDFDLGDYSDLTYPQDLRNCTTCHDGADNYWETIQNGETCFANCHDTTVAPDFSHTNVVTNGTACAVCHDSASLAYIGVELDVPSYHLTVNATANNPDVEAGLVNFEYFIDSVTVDANNNAVITFHIQRDGANLVLGSPAALTGFTGGPSFLFAYAMPQDGIDAPTEYNNLGMSAAQPATQAIVGLTLAGDETAYVATIANAFPVGATLRNVGLQGYWTQSAGTGGIAANTARHTRSVVMAVAGEERREVVSSAACAACHEILEAHGGNRVFTVDGGVEICVTCHVPNLSSSGRTFDIAAYLANPADFNSSSADTVAARGTDPLIWPEATNNLKDMIHGIHSAESPVRSLVYEFVRVRGGNAYNYDWSEVTWPGILSNCQSCHLPDTYDAELPAGALMTTNVTSNGTLPMTRTSVLASRDTVPNAKDEVISQITASCYSCHASDALIGHMEQNGANFGLRENAPAPE